jgi:solute carrier family 31 (copper transporter), member 1
MGKQYDLYIVRQFQRSINTRAVDVKRSSSQEGNISSVASGQGGFVVFRATPLQQLIRALIHAVTFGVAYIIMLLGESCSLLDCCSQKAADA